jgi:hypothetical protein
MMVFERHGRCFMPISNLELPILHGNLAASRETLCNLGDDMVMMTLAGQNGQS